MTLMPGVRADIEGLRAFAVLAVLLNHAYPGVLPGGFAGVDVFFVISGYLIGAHLIEGFSTGTLTFAEFYGRRVRRIFPALAAMLIVVWVGASLVMTGPEFSSLGRHMASAAVFSNNLLLASETGYFDAPALSKPLLHLWSLGVEEQFYLVAPLLVWFGVRREGRAVAWFVRLGALSMLWTLAFSKASAPESFYFLYSRFWELAAGVGLAWFTSQALPARQRPFVRREYFAWLFVAVFLCILRLAAADRATRFEDILSQTGIGLVLLLALLAIHVLGNGKFPAAAGARLGRAAPALGMGVLAGSMMLPSPLEWPGPTTVFPVFGTLLVLAASSDGLVRRILSSKPAVAIGAISYPLYLWHWPLLVGWRLLFPDPSWYELLLPLCAGFLLAWITRQLIEDPARFGRLGRKLVRRPTLWPISSALAVAGLVGLVTLAGNGLPQRFPEGLGAMADWSEPDVPKQWRFGDCYHYLNNETAFSPSCTPVKRPGVPLLLLWGDSHAAHLYPGLTDAVADQPVVLAQWTTGSCPPTLKPLRTEGEACVAKRLVAWRTLKTYVPDTVVLSAAWLGYLRAGNSQDELVVSVRETVRELRSLGVQNILLFGPGPVWNAAFPADLFRHMVRRRLAAVPARFGQVGADLWNLDAALSKAAVGQGASYFSVVHALCNSAGCLTAAHPQLKRPDLVFWDRDHLTPAGSRLLVGKAQAVLKNSLAGEGPLD